MLCYAVWIECRRSPNWKNVNATLRIVASTMATRCRLGNGWRSRHLLFEVWCGSSDHGKLLNRLLEKLPIIQKKSLLKILKISKKKILQQFNILKHYNSSKEEINLNFEDDFGNLEDREISINEKRFWN